MLKKLTHTFGYTLLLIGFVFILGIISYQVIGVGIGYSDDIYITFNDFTYTLILKDIPEAIITKNIIHNRHDTYYSLSKNEQAIYDSLYVKSKNILTGNDNDLTLYIGFEDFDLDFSNQTVKEVEENINSALEQINFNKIFYSLRQDYPYYFWYLYSCGYNYNSPRVIAMNNDFSKSYFELKINSIYSDDSGKYLDSDELIMARSAYKNAKQIPENAVEYNIYDKIKYYTNYILNNTAYYHNHDSDSSNKQTWSTFISVFDNIDSTLSICGGYSDAFKLLCDLGDVECYLETGLMNNEYHAWNEIYINDVTYMIDTTNIDEGAIGQGYKLYLNQASGDEYTFYIHGEAVTYRKLSLDEMLIANS